jgi:hypothetical protein
MTCLTRKNKRLALTVAKWNNYSNANLNIQAKLCRDRVIELAIKVINTGINPDFGDSNAL